MKTIIAITLLTISFSVEAGWKDSLRPYALKFMGENLTEKILGEEGASIQLPSIPKVQVNARSAKSIGNSKMESIPKEQKKKYDYAFILELHQVVRKQRALDNEVSRWMNVLSQGGEREGVYRGVVLDSFYQGLENRDNRINDEVRDFFIGYISKYLDKSMDKESLKNTNFFTLKRIAVEKSLEVIEVLKSEEDIYSWYAVLSKELARSYPSAWVGKFRSNSSKKAHYDWAKSVPKQHLKSEVIIKLHKILNFLQG